MMRLRVSCMEDWAEDLSISRSERLNHRVDLSSGVMAWLGGTSWRRWIMEMEAPKETCRQFFLRVDDDDVAVVVVAAVNDTVAGTGSSLDCSFSAMVRLALASSSSNGSQNNRLA